MNIPEREAARLRVARFLDAWESLTGYGELIYGIGLDVEGGARVLLVADLRTLTEVAP